MGSPSSDLKVHRADLLVSPLNGDAQIYKDDSPACAEDDVVWVDVAVRNAMLVQVRNGRDELMRNRGRQCWKGRGRLVEGEGRSDE